MHVRLPPPDLAISVAAHMAGTDCRAAWKTSAETVERRPWVEGCSRLAEGARMSRLSVASVASVATVATTPARSTHRAGGARRARSPRVSLYSLVASQTHVALRAVTSVSPILSAPSLGTLRPRQASSSLRALGARRSIIWAQGALYALHATLA